jgi:hypothetical protein
VITDAEGSIWVSIENLEAFLSENLLIKTSYFFLWRKFSVCLIISKTRMLGRDKKQIILLMIYLPVSSIEIKCICLEFCC